MNQRRTCRVKERTPTPLAERPPSQAPRPRLFLAFAGLAAAVMASSILPAACSLIVDHNDVQCSSDSDCSRVPSSHCDLQTNVCVLEPPDSGAPDNVTGSCSSWAHPPAAPTVSNAGSGPEVVVVVSQVEQGDVNDKDGTALYQTIGFDVDGLCTVGNRDRACSPPSWTANDPTDGLGGRDNAVARMLYYQGDFIGSAVITTASMNAALQKGESPPPVLLAIRGYNGFPTDDQVEVHWFVPSIRTSAGPFVPKWDGTDVWPVDPQYVASTVGPDAGAADGGPTRLFSKLVDARAYVSNYVLVTRFPGPAPFALLGVTFRLTDVLLVAPLSPDPDTGWRVKNGIFASRMPAGEVLARIADYSLLKVGVPLCTNDPNYPMMKRMMCSFVDLPNDGKPDGTKACEDLSTGIRVEAIGARLGPVGLPLLDPHACSTDSDPLSDSCKNAPASTADN
jgi:hypothetical protein